MTLTFYVGRTWNIFITSSGMLPSSHMFFQLPFSLIWFPHGNPRKDKHIYYICNPVFKAVQRTTKFKMNYSEELSAYTVYTVVYPSGLNMCVLTPPFYMCWKILGRCRIKGKKKNSINCIPRSSITHYIFFYEESRKSKKYIKALTWKLVKNVYCST